ncbi:hypothetical protein [Cellulomonas alba]|uniref:Uncharacterized protein n=1 Tax=Cellulomonas alba TaxID=3053467 RepID=A0ABT7SI47_9CELL|nr:hypothetical protein [Cellulomonas alba]MDM7855867.1 hypothetical protein [Cellulomonas alba]
MTTLRFPTRVVLTVADDRLDDDLVALAVDAADAALTRAVRRAGALDVVRTSAAEPGDVRVGVELRGDPLPETVDAALRRGLGALATARAAALAAVPTPRGRSDAARGPSGESASERAAEQLDPDLLLGGFAAVDDAYLVASYDEGGRRVALPIGGSGRGDERARTGAVQQVRVQLVVIRSVAELEARLRDRYGDAVPSRVVVLSGLDSGAAVLTLVRWRNGAVAEREGMGTLAMYQPPTGAGAGRWRQTSLLDLTQISFAGRADDEAERTRWRIRMLLQLARSRGADGIPEADLRQAAALVVATMPQVAPITSYYWIEGSAFAAQLMEVDQPPQLTDTLPVVAFVEQVATDVTTPEEHATPALPLGELTFGFDPDVARPFLAEPPVEFWPLGVGARLEHLIGEIAAILGMPAGRFPGMFLLAALVRIGQIAAGVGAIVATGEGTPADSPRLARLRTAISAYEPMTRLELLYTALVAGADEGGTAPPPLRHNSASWLLHFYEEYFSRRDGSVRDLFVAACQDQLLDVLETSHRELVQRRRNLSAYLRLTRVLVLLLLVDDVELSELRRLLVERIDQERAEQVVDVAVPGAGPLEQWWSSTSVVLGSLGHVETGPVPVTGRGSLRRTRDGWQVQDSVGRWWTRGDLEAVIAGGRQEAFAVDPFLEKLADLDDVIERMRTVGADGLEDEFGRLLDELRSENEDKTRDVRGDRDIAFGLAAVSEAPRSELGGQLSGIHELADHELRPLFTGPSAEVYDTGLRALIGVELGKAAFLEFINVVGLVALAIVCPEAALVIGAVQAVDAVDTALEHRGIQRAMLGGDRIITHAQAEAELWGAAIGAALVFVPEVPGLLRGTARGVGAVVRGEAREAVATAGREVAENMARHIAELAARDLVVTFARECLQGYLLNLVINAAIQRFAQTIAREVEVTGHASLGDITRLVGDAIAGPAPVTPAPAQGAGGAGGGAGGITQVTP